MKILLVGKNTDNLRRDFSLMGHEVTEAASVKGLRNSQKPDYVIVKGYRHEHSSEQTFESLREKFGENILIMALRPEYSEQSVYSDSDQDELQISDLTNGARYSLPSLSSSVLLRAYIEATYEVQKQNVSFETPFDIGAGIIFDNKDEVLKFNNQIIELTETELRILNILIREQGNPVKRKELLPENNDSIGERTIDVQIKRLRDKIGNALEGDYSGYSAHVIGQMVISVVRTAGYKLSSKADLDSLFLPHKVNLALTPAAK